MLLLTKCLAVISVTVIASYSEPSHASSVFPQELCVQRSLEDRLYSLPPTAAVPEFHLKVVSELDKVILETYESLRMGEADVIQRQRILSVLLHNLSGENVTLKAFGSCCNGFGMVTSDLDVQITGNMSTNEIVQQLSKEFSVVYISKSELLIIFNHLTTGYKVDLGVNPKKNNKIGLSLWLLRKYSRLDARAQILGVFLKAVVKKLKIRETIHGDLSSSAYITMLMHYLQQTNPPVLPEITQSDKKAENFLPRNTATVGQLWLGFLNHYVHEFNYQEDVICLYHRRCKSRKEREWYGPDHNLITVEGTSREDKDDGLRLSPLMSDYTLRVFTQLQTFYLKDSYDGLLRHNDINLDYHPRYGHKRNLLVDTWGYHNRSTCYINGPEWIRSLRY